MKVSDLYNQISLQESEIVRDAAGRFSSIAQATGDGSSKPDSERLAFLDKRIARLEVAYDSARKRLQEIKTKGDAAAIAVARQDKEDMLDDLSRAHAERDAIQARNVTK